MTSNQIDNNSHIIILSGGCDIFVKGKVETYHDIFIESFSIFEGIILSGGTPDGIAKIAADIGEKYPNKIKTIGYLPKGSIPDPRYSKIVHTDGPNFSLAESLQMWIDIVLSKCDPIRIKVIGINGGNISLGEYRIAIAMGANVGLLSESGRAADEMCLDHFWSQKVTPLNSSVQDIQTFIKTLPSR